MKLENFVYIFIFVILNCITKITFAGVKTVNNQYDDNILNRIKNDTHMCISEDIFEHKQLRNCVISMPSDVNIGSEDPLVLLCMSLYDSFLRLCEEPLKNKLKEKIPDLKQFSSLVDSQRNQTVHKFCPEVKENENLVIRNESFNKTAPWINVFISSIKDKEACSRICATVDGKSLQPLCYLIVWGNKFYAENKNTDNVLQASANKIDNVQQSNEEPADVQIPQRVKEAPGPDPNKQTISGTSDSSSTVADTNTVSNSRQSKPEPQPGNVESEGNSRVMPPDPKNIPPVGKNNKPQPGNIESEANSHVMPSNSQQSKPEPQPENTESEGNSHVMPPDPKNIPPVGKYNVHETHELAQENKKNKKPAANNNGPPPVAEGVNDGPIKGGNEDKKTGVETKVNTDLDHAEPEKEAPKETPELNVPETGIIDKPSVDKPASTRLDNIEGNVKDANDEDMGLSNEEENNENGGEVIPDENAGIPDENAGADGLERDEESDDVKIPNGIKEPPVPVENENKQTFKEPAAQAGTKTDIEGKVIMHFDPFVEAEESHFFTYFISMAVLSIIAYLVFHNKKKLVALAVEGRRTRSTTRRRPNTASYSKLDCNLEEAMVSNTTASVTHVLY